MKDCRYCKWINPQLPSHCFKLRRILDNEEILNDGPCEFYINKWDWSEINVKIRTNDND